MKSGKVFLVGAGPGDPGLVTLKAVACLKAADVVVYDQLANPDLLAYAKKNVELIFAGKYSGDHVLVQDEINKVLLQKARQGKTVVRLKGGDPLLFGRGAEEALELVKSGLPFEIVPGVSSLYSVPAYAGIPVTYRNISSRLNVVTGHETPDKGASTINWKKLLDKNATLVILMGFANLPTIVKQITTDKSTLSIPVALISNGTRPNQQVVTGTLANIVERVKASGMKAPAIIVIGQVVTLRDQLNWFRPQPLKGKRVLVTRPEHQAGTLMNILEGYGAKVTSLPLIRIVPSKDTARIKQEITALNTFSWLIFTSINGVDLFLKALAKHKISIASLKNKKFAAIGKKTAETLEKAGIKVDLVPKDFVQEALADTMIKQIAASSTRVLLAHSAGSRPVLEQKLRAAGLEVVTLDLYSAEPIVANQARVKKLFQARKVDAVMLTSSSCVESFVSVFGRGKLKSAVKGVTVASIGPITSDTARRSGLPVTVEAKEYTIEGIAKALVDSYQGKSS